MSEGSVRPFVLRFWWVVVVRGLLALALGVSFLTGPLSAPPFVVASVAVYWILDGILALGVAVVAYRHGLGGWLLLSRGVVAILIGLVLLGSPTQALIPGWRPFVMLSIIFLLPLILLLSAAQTIWAVIMELAVWATIRREILGDWSGVVAAAWMAVTGVIVWAAALGLSGQLFAPLSAVAGAVLIHSGFRLRAASRSGPAASRG
jgi:uncharacterized membrane protein HdeD (DUF308 family)